MSKPILVQSSQHKEALTRGGDVSPTEMPSVATWNYHERTKNQQQGVISSWLREKVDTKGRANFERALDQLKQMPKSEWSKPSPASNIGNHNYVIRFKDSTRSQLRVFGHFHDPHVCFVMTFSGNEKDDVYYPKNYQDLAKDHRIDCDKDFPGRTIKYGKRCSVCSQR